MSDRRDYGSITDADLVAYLDGMLDDESTEYVEREIAKDRALEPVEVDPGELMAEVCRQQQDKAKEIGITLVCEAEPGEHLAWMRTRRGTYMQTPMVYRGVAWFCQDNGVVAAFGPVSGSANPRSRTSARPVPAL